jgi:regulation of enolase protein 1 (concanavalin A-like superfamily)
LALTPAYIQYLQSWVNQDVGPVGVAGSALFGGGTYTVSGSGTDIGSSADAFHYVYQPLSGDGEIVARVTDQDATDPLAKAGVMIRESLAADARNALVAVTPGSGIVFQNRSSPGGDTNTTTDMGFKAPYWVRLTRTGNLFTAYRSEDGESWVQIGDPVMIEMTKDVFVGLAVTSHDNTVLNGATFENAAVR